MPWRVFQLGWRQEGKERKRERTSFSFLEVLGKGQDLWSYAGKNKTHLSKRFPAPRSQVSADSHTQTHSSLEGAPSFTEAPKVVTGQSPLLHQGLRMMPHQQPLLVWQPSKSGVSMCLGHGSFLVSLTLSKGRQLLTSHSSKGRARSPDAWQDGIVRRLWRTMKRDGSHPHPPHAFYSGLLKFSSSKYSQF